MPFAYPLAPHERKHDPAGYDDYSNYKDWLRDEFCFRCVYCLERERWYPSGQAGFGVEHVKPKSHPAFAALICEYTNLVYTCNRCNSHRQDRQILDPCSQALAEHLRITSAGHIEGLTDVGKRLIETLDLNRPKVRKVRERYLLILALYRANPEHPAFRSLYLDAFGFPEDLPNLKAKRPAANARPEGVNDGYFQQRAAGRLPDVYAVDWPV